MTARDIHIPRARWIVVAIGFASSVAILILARDFTFLYDEWIFITQSPHWTLITYLQPHNEHPAILLRLFYTAMLGTVGIRSYIPYLVALLAVHAIDVVLLFEVVRRRAGDLVGIAAAALLALLGAGSEDLFSAFQIAWLASVAFGLGALLALPRRPAIAAACVAVSLMCSGIGVPFAAATTIALALTPQRRRDLAWFVPVAIALAVWYVVFGRHGVHPNPKPSLANLYLAVPYTLYGLSQGVAGVIGVGGWLGVDVLVGAVAVVVWRWRRVGLDPFAVGIAGALVAMYVVTGLTRAQLGFGQSAASRYLYVDAVLWMLLLGDAAAALPWRGAWRPALGACVALACFNNAVVLVLHVGLWSDLSRTQIADLQALDAVRHDSCLNSAAFVDPKVMVYGSTPQLYYPAVDRYGDPVAGKPVVDRAAFDAGRKRLLRPDC